MRWLADGNADEVRAALHELGIDGDVTIRPKTGTTDPVWRLTTARVGSACVAKFAWSQPAALRLQREIEILEMLAGLPCVPGIVAASADPVLLVTRLEPGESLFDAMVEPSAGAQLGAYLASLHSVPGAGLPVVQSLLGFPADTAVLREAVPSAGLWCDWIDDVLQDPVDSLVVHGDLNGDNQIWRDGMLRLVVDYETVGLAEPEYDFRGVVGFGILDAAIDEYERRTARTLSRARMMAWHARGSLDDIRWRTAAGVGLPDGRSPADWVADLDRRRDALLT